MPKRPDLIGIGEFARRVRLTVKQLRNYDDLGLLPPAYVDPESGYRYYHRGQARTAVTVSLLRSLDVPLADVHELLVADSDEVAALLDRQRGRIEAEVERRHRALRSLDRLLGGADLMPYEVVERDEPAAALAGVRATVPAYDLDHEVPALIAALAARLPERDLDAGPIVGVYPLDLEGAIEVFVGVYAPGATGSETLTPNGDAGVLAAGYAPGATGLETLALPATRAAATTHVGRYEELQLAYYPLIAHVEERGLRPAPTVREVYLEGPPAVDPDRARTEVLLPFAPRPEETP